MEEDVLIERIRSYKLRLDGANDGTWELDLLSGRYYLSEQDQAKFFLAPMDEFTNLATWKELIHPDDRQYFQEYLDVFLHYGEGIYENTYRVIGKDGEYHWIYSKGIAEKDANGKIIRLAGSHSDITQQVKLSDRLYRIAYYDSLTDLPNTEKTEADFLRWKSLAQSDDKAALIYIDIDYLNYVNNTRGYDIGDQLIREFADFLRRRFSQEQPLARVSTDEFVVLIFNYGELEKLEEELEHLLHEVRERKFLDSNQLNISCSIGIALYPEHGTDYRRLQQRASIALQGAKDDGKNRFKMYTERARHQVYNFLEIVQLIQKALENGEFHMVYQPIVDTVSCEVKGVESLIRWDHPKKGSISPADFIPIAEQSGMIIALEKWVLNEVFSQCEEWKRENEMPEFVSINLSARGFLEGNLLGILEELLEQYDVNPEEIELEVTETAMLRNMNRVLEILHIIRGIGFRLALDDFGTGYSSLNYLNSLPVCVVKLDKTLIDKVDGAEKDRTVVGAIIGLCHQMGLKVVSEGVERETQAEVLEELSCDYIQGYLYGRPERA